MLAASPKKFVGKDKALQFCFLPPVQLRHERKYSSFIEGKASHATSGNTSLLRRRRGTIEDGG